MPFDRQTIIKLIALAAVVVIVLVLGINFMVRQSRINAIKAEINAYNDRYHEGVYVDGIHLGGMTREEAQATVQKSAQLKCDEWHVRLTVRMWARSTPTTWA